MAFTLKNHPFAVDAFFRESIVLTYSMPVKAASRFLPEFLTPDTFNDKYAFIAVALVQTESLRPAGFPKFLGRDFFLIGYRIFARYTTSAGKRLRGLYILKSETDKPAMKLFGNIFTHYRYGDTDIQRAETEDRILLSSQKSGLDIRLCKSKSDEVPSLPSSSPFKDWKEARRFAGPLPFTFTKVKTSGKVLIVEGVRENWTPMPVRVESAKVKFTGQLNIPGLQLASAFRVENIPYHWKKGKIDRWKQ